jgi:hypothetical protein
MKRLTMIVFLLASSGCHHQAPRVDCDKRLQPINAPAPAVKTAAKPSGAP